MDSTSIFTRSYRPNPICGYKYSPKAKYRIEETVREDFNRNGLDEKNRQYRVTSKNRDYKLVIVYTSSSREDKYGTVLLDIEGNQFYRYVSNYITNVKDAFTWLTGEEIPFWKRGFPWREPIG